MNMENIPDLLEPNVTKHCATVNIVKQAISETRLKTRQKFHTFFEDSFIEPHKIRKLDYDQDSLFIIQPRTAFLQRTFDDGKNGKRRKNQVQKEPELLELTKYENVSLGPVKLEPVNAEASTEDEKTENDVTFSPSLRPRRESGGAAGDPAAGRRSSPRTNSRSSSPDQAQPPTRVRRSSVRVQSPLVRYGNQSPGRKGEPVNATNERKRNESTPRSEPNQHKPSVKRPHDSRKKDTPSQNKIRLNNESFNTTVRTKKSRMNNAESKQLQIEQSILPKKGSRQIKGVTGLKNMGNTCYLNTIVQVLASLKCFRHALMEVECAMQSPTMNEDNDRSKSPPRARRKRNINSLTKSLQKLVQELNAGTKKTLEPSYFVQAVHEQMPSFNGHLQQDVQEFFCQLLFKLEVEKTTHGCSEEILNCVVNRMFTGAWQSEVTCISCGNSNQKREQFNTLPLEFPNKYHKNQHLMKPVSLDYLLEFYTQSERLGRVYNCENCRTTTNGRTRRQSVRTEAAKRITVLESPKCLFIHLKRARYSHINGQEKINCHVDFPEKLQLGPYMTHTDKENNPEYLLRAVVVHHGKYFSSGHYTTYCWNDSENRKTTSGWVQYNDSEVTGSSINDVIQSQAYMLLYVDRELASEA